MFLAITAIFGGIVYATQSNSPTVAANQVPTLPPEAGLFQQISPAAKQVQGQQTAQMQQQAQQQQQEQSQQPDPHATFGVEEGVKASYSAIIKTTQGNITVTLFGKDAPNTVKNFLNKVKNDFYKGLTFHRVEDWVVQGGDPKGNGTGGGLMQTEMNQIPFKTGSLGVARGGDVRVSNDSQFFITKSEASWLNGQYTNFGEVTEGMDVVQKMKIGDKILGITLQ
jgi:peptidyl-prolyl cis-trans isomerase B (cyclophilin B)